MFARGVVSLRTAQLPVPKTLTSKSRVSITYKLIQNKRLQVLYFGHLRKTGGRGCYSLAMSVARFLRSVCFTGAEARRFLLPANILLSPAIPIHTRHSAVSPMFPLHTQKQGGRRYV